jgi:hypothetical protein
VKDVFFGETGPVPVPVPKSTGEPTPAPEVDAPDVDAEEVDAPDVDAEESHTPNHTQDIQDQQDPQDPQAPARAAEPSAKAAERTAKARASAPHHRVRLAAMDEATWVVRLDQAILGYIHRAGTVHVALRGATLNLAVEVGQSVSRARAFALLHSDWRVQAISR